MENQEFLKTMLRYDEDSGDLFWVKNSGRAVIGKKAGFLRPDGYVGIKINKHQQLAHRVIWVLVYGELPTWEIDHANGIKSDNRLSNLRRATPSQNMANRPKRADNKSGFKGVTWSEKHKRWVATATISGKQRYIGGYHTIKEAAEAYAKVHGEQFGEFARI